MIGDNTDQKVQSKWDKYPLWRSDRRSTPLCNSKCPSTQKNSFNPYGISRVCIYSVRKNKTSNCPDRQKVCHTFLPDENNCTCTVDTCDYALQFNCRIAHIASSVNTAADLLSRLQLKVTEKIRLKVREDIQTTPIEVTTSASDVADDEHFFFTQADNENELKEPALE